MKFNVLVLILIFFCLANRINANYEDLQKVINGDLIGNPDLSFEDLCGRSFPNRYLGGVDLYGSSLIGTLFNCTNLMCSDLRKATFKNTGFRGAYLWRSTLQFTKLDNSSFVYADLSEANLVGADMSQADFTNAKLCKAKLKDAVLFIENEAGEIIQGAVVEGADFAFAKGLTDKQKNYLFDHGAICVPRIIVYELEEYENKEVFDPKELSYIERIKRYFKNKYIWKFKSKNSGIQKFEEDLEDYDREVFDPKLLSYKERIKRYFKNKYKWYFGSRNQEVQTDSEVGV